MRLQASFLLLALSATTTTILARPTELNERFLDNVLDTDDVLLLDAPAFPDPSNPSRTLASIQAFVHLRSIDLSPITSILSQTLSNAGLDIGSQMSTFQERVKYFAALGLPGKRFEVEVAGCERKGEKTKHTSLSTLGVSLSTVPLGKCSSGVRLEVSTKIGLLSKKTVRATVFSAPDSGFGVISDIDDTIKISNVLDTTALLKSTFLDTPKPVPGMPQLYTSLSQSLSQPQFFYITGSPYQLFPTLSEFIKKDFSPTVSGPIFTKNLTVVNPVDLVNFFTNSNTREYKGEVIDRLRGFYPNKRWLAIGDSTQQDPEAYGDAFRKHGESISCIWIRKVDGADNTDARFAKAFSGVPNTRFRTFFDNEMSSLAKIDVAGGQC